MLSFEENKGRKIARIEGGKHNGRHIFLSDEGKFNEIILSDGKLQPLPNKEVIEKVYISAPSGAGKSYYAGKYIKEYLKMHPSDEFYLISSIDNDPSLDKSDPIRIEINEELIEDPIHPSELKDSIVVFDDVDVISNSILRKSLNSLRNEILEVGRHYRTSTISTSHLLLNRNETRRIINEATSITFFTKSGSLYSIRRYLREYLGLDKLSIDKILKIKSRWITIYTHSPQYIIYEKGVLMLHSLRCDEDDK